MPTLLDGVLERHEGPEPRVVAADVQRILKAKVRPGDDESGDSVTLIAERADVSPRTVYRVLQGDKPTLSLNTADELVLACGSHLALGGVRLAWNGWPEPGGYVTDYLRVLPDDDLES